MIKRYLQMRRIVKILKVALEENDLGKLEKMVSDFYKAKGVI